MTRDEIEALAERLDHAYYIVTRPNLGWPRRSVSIAVDDCGGAVTALRALAQENETLRADKERLDWLERAACSDAARAGENTP